MLNKFVVGHIPGKPQGGRHGMVFGQISSSTIGNSPQKPLVPGQSCTHINFFYIFFFFLFVDLISFVGPSSTS
jgi:hypothetical protein